LIIFYDYHTDSSFFGTLQLSTNGEEPVVYAVNYDGAAVEIRGASALSSGDYLMYVVRQRPFFTVSRLCRPIDEKDEEQEATGKTEQLYSSTSEEEIQWFI
jgi:hypothetical protein